MAKETVSKKPVLTAEQKANAKRAAFAKVVTPRVIKALKAIRLIGNCASANYLYTPEQAQKIIATLHTAVEGVQGIYSKKVTKVSEFSLSS